MSWVTLMAPTHATAGLGSAQAGARWGWAEPRARTLPPAPANRQAPRPHAASSWAPTRYQSQSLHGDGRPGGAVATPAAPARTHEPAPVVAQSIAEAALLLGRNADDIWAEAAREWLGRHLGLVAIVGDDANDDPPPTAPAAALATRRASRSWVAIDALLEDLRAPAA